MQVHNSVPVQRHQWSGEMAYLPAAGLVLATPILVWAAIGRHDTGDDYTFGPYAIDVGLEVAVGVVAAIVFAASLSAWWRGRRRVARARSLSPGTVVLSAVATGLVAAAWRVMTAGGIGANIGAGLMALFVPFLVAGALAGAVICQHAFVPIRTFHFVLALVVTVAVGPALFFLALAMAG